MEKLKLDTGLKKILAIEIILALGLSIFLLSKEVIKDNKVKKEIGKYKDIQIPIIKNVTPDKRSFNGIRGFQEAQEKADYEIIGYELYLLNTETGEIKSTKKQN
jgi:hypothetical protein